VLCSGSSVFSVSLWWVFAFRSLLPPEHLDRLDLAPLLSRQSKELVMYEGEGSYFATWKKK